MPSVQPISSALFLIVAFIFAGLVHSVWLRSAYSRRLAIPLDGGRKIRGRRLFGENKTVRGLAVMIPAAAVSFAILGVVVTSSDGPLANALWPLSVGQYALLGAWAGFWFMAAELPNSFVKRQLDIAPGSAPAGRVATVVSFLVDRLDSIVGMLAAVTVAVPTPWATWGWVLLLGPAVHWSFSLLLYGWGVKGRPA